MGDELAQSLVDAGGGIEALGDEFRPALDAGGGEIFKYNHGVEVLVDGIDQWAAGHAVEILLPVFEGDGDVKLLIEHGNDVGLDLGFGVGDGAVEVEREEHGSGFMLLKLINFLERDTGNCSKI